MQACEAATASVSRPGSPQDLVSRNLPEEELVVRSKLEDLIDQVSVRSTLKLYDVKALVSQTFIYCS